MTEATRPADARGTLTLWAPLKQSGFRQFFTGSILSMLGTQLTFVAFPWLVLKVTGDAAMMGLVLAVEGVPRAAFMLVGGTFTDRFSPRTVILASTLARALVMLGLGALVLADPVIFAAALAFGILDAFAWPASSAFVPRLLPAAQLPAGNALTQGMSQLAVMMGPATAGLLIAWFAVASAPMSAAGSDLPGIGAVFVINGCGFALALLLFLRIQRDPPTRHDTAFTLSRIAADMGEGFRAMWHDLPVRIITLVFTVLTLFWRGPYLVGIPVLADARFAEGALAFGFIGSAFGLGALLGAILAGTLPRLPQRFLGVLVLADTTVLGTSFFVYAWTSQLEAAMAITALCGLLDGYFVVLVISWLQLRVPRELLGRVMAMIMFFNSGLAPVSAALAGVLISLSMTGLFLGAGICMIALSLLGLALPVVRRLGMDRIPVRPEQTTPA